MKSLRFVYLVLLTIGFWLSGSPVSHAAGLLIPTDSGLQPLTIQEHHVTVVIEDGYAITRVEQVFGNPNDSKLEAIYSFPIPEKAAVGEFSYWIDGQPVTGEVLAKEQAREIHETEKQAGRETALAEQDSYRTFDIAVYPVLPAQDVRIQLTYIQPAHVDSSVGRYVYPLEEGGVDEQRLAFWTYQEAVEERFSFNLTFRSSWPIDDFRLPQHPQALIQQLSEQEWTVSMASDAVMAEEGVVDGSAPAAVHRLDQDIVVYWRQAQGLPGSVDMVAYREQPAGRGTFMLTLTPGDDLAPITEGRDWVFVLDLSGSMEGKYRSLVEGVNKGLSSLNPEDRFRIILFNNRAREITSGFAPATPENVKRFIRELENTDPDNGTNLYAGLSLGMNSLDADRSSALVLVTDGVANVGFTEKKDFLELLKGQDARLFTFVMGNSANRPLLESMAKVSNGFAMNVSNSDDIAGKLLEATSRLTHEAMHDIDIRFAGVKVADLSPEHIGSLYRGQQLIVFGHYWGDGEARVIVDTRVSGEDRSYATTFNFPETAVLHPEIERLWAFAKIEDLQSRLDYFGEGADLEQAITDLAVENGLVTDYTSMIVLSEERFDDLGIKRLNKARVERELLARQERALQGVRDNRVDQNQPMYSNNRASHSNGGGAFGPWMLLLLLPLLVRHFRARPDSC
ncbi:MAG: VWA domain-containing protein [Xanthomonadales bacterium]|nr:VIT and VWA domain-containing protein [Gammaproteobacteria bacterium]NNK51353.1 VWA domain-containing protein [Xanthomonadales bacterium]